LKPVEYCGFTSSVKAKNQNPSFSGAKQATEVAEQAS